MRSIRVSVPSVEPSSTSTTSNSSGGRLCSSRLATSRVRWRPVLNVGTTTVTRGLLLVIPEPYVVRLGVGTGGSEGSGESAGAGSGEWRVPLRRQGGQDLAT